MVMFPIRSPFVLFLIRSRSVLFPVCSLAGFRLDPSEEITAKVYTPSEEIIGITYVTILQRGIDNQRITC